MTKFANGGRAIIENGFITIRVPVDALPLIVKGAEDVNNWQASYRVTDPAEFAKELVTELNRESENGTTRIHKMFDGAILEAIEQGAFGIESDEQSEKGEN